MRFLIHTDFIVTKFNNLRRLLPYLCILQPPVFKLPATSTFQASPYT